MDQPGYWKNHNGHSGICLQPSTSHCSNPTRQVNAKDTSTTSPRETNLDIHLVIDTARYSSLAKLLVMAAYAYWFL